MGRKIINLLVKQGTVVIPEPIRSWLPSAQNNSHAKVTPIDGASS